MVDLARETRVHEGLQDPVDGGAGQAGQAPADRVVDLVGGRVVPPLGQLLEDGAPLDGHRQARGGGTRPRNAARRSTGVGGATIGWYYVPNGILCQTPPRAVRAGYFFPTCASIQRSTFAVCSGTVKWPVSTASSSSLVAVTTL